MGRAYGKFVEINVYFIAGKGRGGDIGIDPQVEKHAACRKYGDGRAERNTVDRLSDQAGRRRIVVGQGYRTRNRIIGGNCRATPYVGEVLIRKIDRLGDDRRLGGRRRQQNDRERSGGCRPQM